MTDDAPNPPDATESPATRRLPPFAPSAFMWQLRRDAWVRRAIIAAVLVVFAGLSVPMLQQAGGRAQAVLDSTLTLPAVLLAIGAWLFLSMRSASVTRSLPEVSALIDANPDVAEGALADLLARKPLFRWVRLLLYHRLAVLRHRQRRFAEAAAVSQSVLAEPMGVAAQTRPHLLLILAESRLECRDVHGAYWALTQLYWTRLGLVEALQRLALQTRYEVMIGHDTAALRAVANKVEMAELMPAPQCGALHAMLAVAASRTEQTALAGWLWQRVDLLCEPAQASHFREWISPDASDVTEARA